MEILNKKKKNCYGCKAKSRSKHNDIQKRTRWRKIVVMRGCLSYSPWLGSLPQTPNCCNYLFFIFCVCVFGGNICGYDTCHILALFLHRGKKKTWGMTLPAHWKQSELRRLGKSICCERRLVPPRGGQDKRAERAMNHMLLSPDPEP